MFETLSDVRVQKDISMATLTTFKTGGNAAYVLSPQTISGLILAINEIKAAALPYAILGNGSNVLAPDEDFCGVIIETTDLKQVEVDGNRIKCLAGTSLSRLAITAMKAGLSGLEFAYGIPGTVGGALCMNAGAYGGEMKDVVESVTFLNAFNHLTTLKNNDLQFGYRESYFQHNPSFICECTVILKEGDASLIKETMDTLMSKRTASQPLTVPSAGSTFRRPQNAYAAQLIDLSGLKGFRIGGACVSQKHAGFVVNDESATTRDILAVIDHVRKTVFEKHGVLLEREVQLLEELLKTP